MLLVFLGKGMLPLRCCDNSSFTFENKNEFARLS